MWYVYALSLLFNSFILFLILVRCLYIVISLSDKVTVENVVEYPKEAKISSTR